MRKNITVTARMINTGNIVPIEIVWEDGRIFKIDKIVDKRNVSSTKGGGKGIRYTIKINNQEKYLFLDEYIWFVEV